MSTTFVIQNRKEVLNLLKQLPKGFGPKFLRKVLGASVTPTVKAAQARAPRRTGILIGSLGKIQLRRSKFVALIVGPRVKGRFKASRDPKTNKGGWYGQFVEFGTRNQPAQPFMRPAFDSTQKAVSSGFFALMIKKFELEVRRLTKKGVI